MNRFHVNGIWTLASLLGMLAGIYPLYVALMSSNTAFLVPQGFMEALFTFSLFSSIRYRNRVLNNTD